MISTALLIANHQKVEGSSDARSQFLAMVTMFFQWLSTRPFCDWQRGGAAEIGICSLSRSWRTSPPMSFWSKSVRISPMCCRPTFVMNFLIPLTRLSVRLSSGNTCLYLVRLSTKNKQYLAPPIALDGPNPMSTCQMSPNLVGRATFFWDLLWLCMVAVCPGFTAGLVSP